MTPQTWLATGAFVTAAAIIAGAFGAHGLKARLDADALALWETAARYLVYGGLAIMAVGLAGGQHSNLRIVGPARALLIGSLVFSGTVGALALGGPRWLGAVTPLGGALMIAGLVWFGVAVLAG